MEVPKVNTEDREKIRIEVISEVEKTVITSVLNNIEENIVKKQIELELLEYMYNNFKEVINKK